jgi:transcription-repair coupling factor (superfamily II helicase)
MELRSFLKEHGEKVFNEIDTHPGFYILKQEGYGSFISHQEKIVILDEVQIFTKRIRKAIKYRSVLNQSTKVRTTDDLNVGDFVVHYDYGIGRYVGLKTMELSGEKRDYLQIIYANEESLYVPMDQIEMVLKYATHDGMKPKLSKMGGKTWTKTKASVRMKIKDFSDRLIKLYAAREHTKGFKYAPDSEMQLQFERDFLYEPTKDQVKTIIETKGDMETEKPMDRLICGDVGFGKTEVAMRAAFKAVLNQKQVLYLVPTTVLARQHFYTFKDRFEKYGANIALMSRFVTTKQQNETLKKLSKGYVDVVIGTHRLLSKDIVFKDLGLLIVDEEQRFGVEHKERIREIKQNVDTLTLSATPIPRTLQMSLLGLKDLSMIETPPMNRYPVQTYVVERHEALVKEAIMREIARGGQVFYLYNRVQGMEGMVKRLQKLVPEARIGYAHGKMNRTQLESTLSDFIEHEFDVLVSTTIIETGVDIPNTNTLIIHEADRLGLSQLYQIRGRVGRSDRIAYAYLLYDAGKVINDEAKKRLSAIKDFTALGSGYKIALRDLSIRGAGDILGAEQSGFVDSVGVELYMKLLEEAITGENMDDKRPTQIDEVFAARHVDDTYVSEDSARIEIHKRISELNHLSDVEDLKDELTDRYGTLDVDLLLYMYEKLYKKLAHKFGVQKTMVGAYTTTVMLTQEASQQMNGQSLFRKASAFNPKIELKYERRHIYLIMNTQKVKEHWLYLFAKFLDEYFQEREVS